MSTAALPGMALELTRLVQRAELASTDLWVWLQLRLAAFTRVGSKAAHKTSRLAADVRGHVEEQNPYAVGGVATLVAVALLLGVLFVWVASRQVRPRKMPPKLEKRPSSPTSKRLRHNSKHSKSFSDLLEAERERMQENRQLELEDNITFPKELRQNCGPENLKFIYDTLSKVFSFLRGEFVEPLARDLRILRFSKGETIFNKGELDGSILLIVNGSVSLSIHGDGGGQRFSKLLGRGDTLTSSLPLLTVLVDELQHGECSAQVKKVCGSLSARAEEDGTRLFKIPTQSIKEVLEKYPEAFYRLSQAALSQVEKITAKSLIDHFGLSSKIISATPLVHPLLLGGEEGRPVEDTPVKDLVESVADAIGLHDSDLRSTLVSCVKVIKRTKKQTIREPGDSTSALGVHIVLDGSVSVQVATATQTYAELYKATKGCEVGISTCFVGSHYFATRNVCVEDTTLLWIPDTLFCSLLQINPVRVKCVRHLIEQYSDLVCVADTSFDWLHLHSGESLFDRGDLCDSVFTVISGRLRAVQVHCYRGKEVETTNELVRGATLGAMDMLGAGASNSSVFAIRDSQISQMSRNVFDYVVSKYPTVLVHFTKNLARRMPTPRVDSLKADASGVKARSNYLLSLGSGPTTTDGQKTGSNLPIGTVSVISLTKMTKIQTFCSHLEMSLKTLATVETVSSQKAKAFLGDQWISNSRVARANLTAWMGDIESSNELVIYEADPHLTAWTKLCIRQADHVLLLCSDTHPQQAFVSDMISILEDAWDKRDAVINVVRVREKDWTLTALKAAAKQEANGSSRSYALKKKLRLQMDSPLLPRFILPMEKYEWISGFHNVQVPFEEHRSDFMRLSRRITGNSVGLVLGGGGARGLAHIGVLRALQECGIHVDVVGGTSIGAFIGGIYALHPNHLGLVESKVKQLSAGLSSIFEKLRDLTLPISSFFNGTRFNQSIRAHFYDLSIEDLMLNYFCVSTDIAKSRMSVHRSGPAWKYVRASMSLQGYFPPISENGSLLLDGGYMNNLPADIMKEEGGIKYIFAVDVGSESRTDFYDYGSALSGWWLLWNKLNPFAKTVAVPSMGDVSAALAYVSSEQHKDRIREECIDLYLRPPVKDYGTLEFNKMEEIIEVGYNYALPRIQAWMARVLDAEPEADIKRTTPLDSSSSTPSTTPSKLSIIT
ncbi:Patatin-like phospholipase domain-containing protein 7 [Phytophthora fragariae]|uniref:Patatin-like phospholipase domain-containing protein 7 n=1 Tax=Phytophthora fragariae TaxID=53985 RepID=A0A6A3THR4_9STRA|nr:Patatin-like phospholipase domain-containing protein 7 [Phytophthora fragariae]KAE8948395.1 Patatin-like phospholipase domain-containing protein 7 [Phytophthora fragariae]KAE9028924.1 Patatin-like phospholipase domain-containing protein 7 [Phytophthora fragariae]KAE9136934.1 Patatin-like phospholipase domain-containing protein 7 [Phytophthora fragariae]KAE9145842.1 Patatin-like phospholipase domain-containing protein 7 [Phytophthora fragariae]